MAPPDIVKTLPVFECLSSESFAQSATEYPNKLPPVDLYCSVKLSVPFRYQKILLTAVRWACVGAALNFETIPMACVISGCVALAACNRLPTID